MAETLGIVGFAITAPGVAIAFVQYGRFLSDRINALKNASKNIKELQKFVSEVYEGPMKTTIHLAEWILSLDSLDSGMKSAIQNQLNRLERGLLDAKQSLDEMFDESTGKMKRKAKCLEFFGLTRGRELVKDLNSSAKTLKGLVETACAKKAHVPDDLLLTAPLFSMHIYKSKSTALARLGEHSHILFGTGEIDKKLLIPLLEDTNQQELVVTNVGSNIQEINIVVERRTPSAELSLTLDDLENSTAHLARKLRERSGGKGILPVLGYRKSAADNQIELIFQIPEKYNAHSGQTLHQLLVQDLNQSSTSASSKALENPMFRRTLDARIRLAKQVSEAVMSVHAAGFVHKNIRANSILLFQPNPSESSGDAQEPTVTSTSLVPSSPTKATPFPRAAAIGDAFLSDFEMVRKDTEASSRYTPEAHILYNIYRHPDRQGGPRPQKRYSMNHDIYSLGVVLLEIGLWEPFVQDDPTDPTGGRKILSETFERAAIFLHPHLERGQAAAHGGGSKGAPKFAPNVVTSTLKYLAETLLPQRLGCGYTKLVVSCLEVEGVSGLNGLNGEDVRNGMALEEIPLGKAVERFSERVELLNRLVLTES